MAFDPTQQDRRLLRLRRTRRIALALAGVLSVLFVLGLRRCSWKRHD